MEAMMHEHRDDVVVSPGLPVDVCNCMRIRLIRHD